MSREWDRDEPLAIEDLRPSTLEALAERLLESTSFEELVYRESETDALFTLLDIAIKTSSYENLLGSQPLRAPAAVASDLYRLRGLVFQAHDLIHESRTEEAAELLRRAAAITRSWS